MEISIELVLGGIAIIGAICGGIGWFWHRAYNKGSEDAIDENTHKSLKKEIKNLSEQVDASETRIKNTVEDKVQQADKTHRDFEKKFAEHIEDDKKAFSDIHHRIDQTHTRIDSVSDDTSYIKGAIDTFLRKQKD